MRNLLDTIKNYTSELQVLSSFILVVITIYYAYITNKILQSSYKTYLKPVSFKSNGNQHEIIIKNMGSANAFNIKLKTIVKKNIQFDPKEGINKVWFDTDFETADGNFELVSGTEGSYTFSSDIYHIGLNEPFYIEWSTITGKKQKLGWLYSSGYKKSIFKPLKRSKHIKFKIDRILISLKSPFVRIKKWITFKNI